MSNKDEIIADQLVHPHFF